MICSEARQYIFAFLDNELDSALSLEMQQHIEHCPLCARECEIENLVRKRLAEKLQHPGDAPALDESVLVRMLRASSSGSAVGHAIPMRRWRLATGVGIAATLLIAATLVLRDNALHASSLPFVDALVDDFDRHATDASALEIVSEDASKVSRWLRDRTLLAVDVPVVDASLGTLLGGRKCKINGAPAAFAMYRVGEEGVSVVAVHESDQTLEDMQRIDRGVHTHWVDQCRGHTVLVWRRGGLIYAVVSRLSEDVLLAFTPSAKG